MVYIFMDESGDLGFDFAKPKTSKYFVITLLLTADKKSVENIIKKMVRSLHKKQLKSHHGVLHSYKENASTRQKVLTTLAEKDVQILAIRLNKQKVRKLKDKKHVLYNFVTHILVDRLLTSRKLLAVGGKITLVASRRETKKLLNENFQTYVKRQVSKNHKLNLEVVVKTPDQEKGLQAADMACWAIYRKWEHKDGSYYRLIKSKIIEDRPLFP